MAVIQADKWLDVVAATQRKLERLTWTNLTSDLTEMVFMPHMMKKEKVTFSGGYGIQRNVLTDHNHSARNVGLFQKDNVSVGDALSSIFVPWRHTTADYLVERRAMRMNSSDPEQIVDLVKTERTKGMLSLAEKMEENGWGSPTDSADELTPWGITYWIQKRTASNGFTGLDPTCAPLGRGGLSSASNPRWANWAAQYSAVTEDDFVERLFEASVKTKFLAPVTVPKTFANARRGLYCGFALLSAIRKQGTGQNENLGRDIVPLAGEMVFNRTPFTYVPYLDTLDATGEPLYGIDWNYFKIAFLKGEYLNEDGPEKVPGMHTSYQTFIDSSWNIFCDDLRRQWCLHK